MNKKKYILILSSIFVGLLNFNVFATVNKTPKNIKENQCNIIKKEDEGLKNKFLNNGYLNKEYDLVSVKIVEKKMKEKVKGFPVLFYKHKNTGAFIVFFLHKDLMDFENLYDLLFFENIVKDLKGIGHALEHLIFRLGCTDSDSFEPYTNSMHITLKDKSSYQYSKNNIQLFIDVIRRTKEFLNDIEKLKDFFKKEIYKKINVCGKEYEQGRIYNEIVGRYILLEDEFKEKFKNVSLEDIENYNAWRTAGGTLEEIKKYSVEEIKDLFYKVIHPSNSIMFINVLHTPEKVKECLDVAAKWYDEYADNKRKIFLEENLKDYNERNEKVTAFIDDFLKKYKKLLCHEDGKGATRFTLKENFKKKERKCTNYAAKVICILDNIYGDKLTSNQKYILENIKPDAVFKILGKEIKKLGYDYVKIKNCWSELTLKFHLEMTFYGNDEKSFNEEKIKKDFNDLLSEFFKVIKDEKENVYEQVFKPFNLEYISNMTDFLIEERTKTEDIISDLTDYMNSSFACYGDPLDERIVPYKEDKFITDLDKQQELIKENIDELSSKFKFDEENEKRIIFYEIDKDPFFKRLSQKEKAAARGNKALIIFLNIEKLINKNRHMVPFILEEINKYNKQKNEKEGLTYRYPMVLLNYMEPVLYFRSSEKEKDVIKYYYKNLFDEDMKNYNISKAEYLKNIKLFIELKKKEIEKIKEIMKKNNGEDLIEKLENKELENTYETQILFDIFALLFIKFKDTLLFKNIKEMKAFECKYDILEKKVTDINKKTKNMSDKYRVEEFSKILEEFYKLIIGRKNEVLDFLNKEIDVLEDSLYENKDCYSKRIDLHFNSKVETELNEILDKINCILGLNNKECSKGGLAKLLDIKKFLSSKVIPKTKDDKMHLEAAYEVFCELYDKVFKNSKFFMNIWQLGYYMPLNECIENLNINISQYIFNISFIQSKLKDQNYNLLCPEIYNRIFYLYDNFFKIFTILDNLKLNPSLLNECILRSANQNYIKENELYANDRIISNKKLIEDIKQLVKNHNGEEIIKKLENDKTILTSKEMLSAHNFFYELKELFFCNKEFLNNFNDYPWFKELFDLYNLNFDKLLECFDKDVVVDEKEKTKIFREICNTLTETKRKIVNFLEKEIEFCNNNLNNIDTIDESLTYEEFLNIMKKVRFNTFAEFGDL